MSAATPTPTSAERKDFLDAARGCAALLVLLDHGLAACCPAYREYARSGGVFGFAAGQIGVVVFFMVSGFVVPMSLAGSGTLRGFWQRRIFRLFPVYWLSLLLALAYLAAGGTALGVRFGDLDVWASNALMIQGYVNRPHVWGVYWTLPYELLIYFVCSLLFVCRVLDRVGARTCLVALVLLAAVGAGRPLVGGKPASLDGMRQMVFFACLFGLLASRHVAARARGRTVFGLLVVLFASVGLVWAVNYALFPEVVKAQSLARTLLVWGTAYGTFFGLLALRHLRMPRVGCWLGRRSYPIYLLHPFVLLVLPDRWSPWVFLPCLIGSTFVLSALVHRFVERPGVALGRRLEARAKPAPVPEPQTPPTRRAA